VQLAPLIVEPGHGAALLNRILKWFFTLREAGMPRLGMGLVAVVLMTLPAV
jgi:hypothetical protein